MELESGLPKPVGTGAGFMNLDPASNPTSLRRHPRGRRLLHVKHRVSRVGRGLVEAHEAGSVARLSSGRCALRFPSGLDQQ